MKTFIESYQFTDLASLRDWLNQFEKTDLSTVLIESEDKYSVTIDWIEESLTDGSKVNNAVFK